MIFGNIPFLEILKVAIKSLAANRTRSFLTILGIIIGVGAVIAASAAGRGANKVIDDQIAALGSNFMHIRSDRAAIASSPSPRFLTTSDAEAIARECSGLEAVAPTIDFSEKVIYGNSNWSTRVTGSTESFAVVGDWRIVDGRNLSQADDKGAAKVCILGRTVAQKLFDEEEPVGKIVRVHAIPFTVVGVFDAKGLPSFGDMNHDDFILVPIETLRKRIFRNSYSGWVSVIMVKGISMKALSYLEIQITDLLRERHGIKQDQRDDFHIYNVSQMLETRRKATRTMSLLLGSIAVISLLVGGIGIMNIMLVSVTERTKEIGIRMAVGAKPEDIRIQFLTEAVILSLIGGMLGILLGIGASIALARVLQSPPVFSADSIVLAFFFSTSVGIVFGFYPAWRASLLNPIDALKHD